MLLVRVNSTKIAIRTPLPVKNRYKIKLVSLSFLFQNELMLKINLLSSILNFAKQPAPVVKHVSSTNIGSPFLLICWICIIQVPSTFDFILIICKIKCPKT